MIAETWFDLTLPWEEPKSWRWLAKRRWRQRHERIIRLERAVGLHRWGVDALPWGNEGRWFV